MDGKKANLPRLFFASSFCATTRDESVKIRCPYFLLGSEQPHESLAQRQAGNPRVAMGPGDGST